MNAAARILGLALALALLPGCPPEAEACRSACEHLVRECRFAAYPSLESCEQGCAVDAARGASVGAMASCLVEAECDTHAVVTCARAAGGSQ